jgi:two-component system, sensor histidine kinase
MAASDNNEASGISWISIVAIAFGGCNLSFFLFGPLFTMPGTISVLLLFIGQLISYLAAPGWLKLILSYPNKVGGITPAAAECLRPYSQILGTIIGIGYWIAWTCASSFSAMFFSITIKQWVPINVSTQLIAVILIVVVTGMTLLGLKWLSKILIPIALVTFIITLVSILLPIASGQINWNQAFTYKWKQPFPGWFGTITSLMGGLYYVGWVVPAFESSMCFMGEMKDNKRGIKYVLLTSIFITSIYCIVIPIIWLGVLGPDPIKQDIIQVSDLSHVFISLGMHPAILLAVCFLTLNTILSAFTPLCNAPRTLAQLADDGFIPKIFSQRTVKNKVPWIATLVTSAVVIYIILYGAKTWLIAATNFDYLICVSIASIAACMIVYHDKKILFTKGQGHSSLPLYLGLIPAGTWILATILGFQQFGFITVVIGIAFAFSGSLFLVYRKISNQVCLHKPWFMPSLQIKFIGILFLILTLDSFGYFIAVQYILQLESDTPLVTVLVDIFITVALLTISGGLVIPGAIVTAVDNLAESAINLANTTLLDFSKAMIALGKGNLENASVNNMNIVPLPVYSNDEIGKMAEGFNLLQAEIIVSAQGLKGAREKLIQARKELLEINEKLENRVKERTKELAISNQTLQETLNDLTLAQDKLIEIGKMSFLEGLISSITNQISEPIGIAVTATSKLKADLSTNIMEFNNRNLTYLHLKKFLGTSQELTNLIEKNLRRAVDTFDNFMQLSTDQFSDSQVSKNFYLKECLEFIILSLQPSLKKAHLTIDLECPENLVIKSYPGTIFQIISILVKNSIMHGFKPEQTGKIDIQVTFDDDNVILKYSDNGCGIPPENMNRIFEPFFTTKYSKGCLGLGLHIAHSSIVRLLNGTIHCESILGQGTTFIITGARYI